MTLKLYGSPTSTCTKRVATVLHEKNVPFVLVKVDMSKAEHKSEEHLKIQPFGQVPVLEDDGFFLYESRAIARYIAIKYAGQGTQLIPTDPNDQALFEQATSIEAFNFNPYATGIIWEKFSKKHRGLQIDEVQAENLSISLNARLDVLADLFHLPCGAKLYVAGQGDFIDKRPNVKRWFEELTNRESWKAVKDGVNSTA